MKNDFLTEIFDLEDQIGGALAMSDPKAKPKSKTTTSKPSKTPPKSP